MISSVNIIPADGPPMFWVSVSTSTGKLDDRRAVVEQHTNHGSVGVIGVGAEDDVDFYDFHLVRTFDQPLDCELDRVTDLFVGETVEDIGPECNLGTVDRDDDVFCHQHAIGR